MEFCHVDKWSFAFYPSPNLFFSSSVFFYRLCEANINEKSKLLNSKFVICEIDNFWYILSNSFFWSIWSIGITFSRKFNVIYPIVSNCCLMWLLKYTQILMLSLMLQWNLFLMFAHNIHRMSSQWQPER